MNMKSDYKSIEVHPLTHEQVRRKAEEAAAAKIEDPTPELEDIAPATFEAEVPAASELAVPEPTVAEALPVESEASSGTGENSNQSEGEVQTGAPANDLIVEATIVVESDTVVVDSAIEPTTAETITESNTVQ